MYPLGVGVRLAHRLEAAWRRAIRPGAGHPAFPLLVVLSWIYRLLSAVKRGFFWRLPGTSTRVDALVVSVGNLSIGGTGKTPLAAMVAETFASRELPTVILCRGYGASPRSSVALAGSGGRPLLPAREIGDEGQLLIEQAPHADLVVAKRRALGARFAVEDRKAMVVVLDDGLQYWRLERDADLVAIDAADPWGNGWIFPAGPLREPPESLARAHAVFLKTDDDGPVTVPPEVERFASGRPLYAMHYRPRAWRRFVGGQELPPTALAGRLASAATGIAQPEPFFARAEALSGHRLVRRAFPDHHRFSLDDLEGLPTPIAMTEKDGKNLPPGPLPEIWLLRVELEIRPLAGSPGFEEMLTRLLDLRGAG